MLSFMIHFLIICLIILDVYIVHKRYYWRINDFSKYMRYIAFPVLYISYCVVNFF